MTARPPHGPLGTRLRAVHARVRRAIALRHALHAARLVFAHPVDGRELRFESPLAADMRELLEFLRAKG